MSRDIELPLPPQEMAAVLARKHFGVFLELVFQHLNPGATLSRATYLQAMTKVLEDVASGDLRRLIITVPPRHLKSISVNVAFAAWMMGRDPGVRIICASYGQDLSLIHSRNFRKVIESEWYRRVFPAAVASFLRITDTEVTTRRGGFRYATALGGTVTGVGADLIIIDDLMKAGDVHFEEAREKARRFIDETLISRFDDKKNGALISIQQRLHEDDPVDHLKAKGGYTHLDLPAIAERDEEIALPRGRIWRRRIGDVLDPLREPIEVLERQKAEMGARAFNAQYQQNPTPSTSEYITWSNVQFYDTPPERHELTDLVISWDTAYSPDPRADYSVGTVWGHTLEGWTLLDLVRVRLTADRLLERIRAECDRWRATTVLVEEGGVGEFILADLRQDRWRSGRPPRRGGYTAIGVRPEHAKLERMMAQVDKLYSGFARFPRAAPWLEDLRHELQAFPDGRHDDQVDSMSQFLCWASSARVRASHGEGRHGATRQKRRLETQGFRFTA